MFLPVQCVTHNVLKAEGKDLSWVLYMNSHLAWADF